MESANIHQTLHEFQLVGSSSSSSSSSLATTSCYGVSTTTTHVWNAPSFILNTNSLSSHPNETLLNQRREENTSSSSLLSSQSYNSSMAPNSSFNYWSNPNFMNNQSAEDLQISRVKEELADNYYLRYTELLSNSPCLSSTDQEQSLIRVCEPRNYSLQMPNDHHHLSTKFLMKSFSSGNLVNKAHEGGLSYSSNVDSDCGKGFTQVFPSVPVSNLLNQRAGLNSSQGPPLDFLTSSSRFGGNFIESSLDNQLGMLRDGCSYGFDQHIRQQSHQFDPMHHSIGNKVSSCSSNGVAEAKRTSSKMDPSKQINESAAKKQRLEARASCPPLKVRKEKLGDRIAALLQLVSPFGKTDTASVLMEAIGYIKFLQNQVETLSVPYMKAARNKSNRMMKGVCEQQGPINPNKEVQGEEEEPNRDLKSRGLCLVPLTCLSYIADGGGGGGAAVWPPSHYGGVTEQY